jgi:ABC-type transport system involved in cytochrome bd biosynthesis fused ATPase/permease subunit
MSGRNRGYFLLMGTCVTLVVLAWWVVRRYSVTAAIVMSVVAMAIPPIAVIVANAGDEASRRQ